MTFEELMTKYWGQITLLLIGISYFIKRAFDNQSKKIEINHSLFQQNRLNVANKYFACYSKVELMWSHFAIYRALKHQLDVNDMDNIIFPPINELKQSLLEMRIYFDDDIYKLYEELTNNLILINDKLSNLYFSDDQSTSLTVKANNFNFFKDDILKKNIDILNIICGKIRVTFKT